MKLRLLITITAATFGTAGCGSETDAPDLGTVQGTVKLDGEIVAGASLLFYPVDGGRSSTAVTDAEGKYSLEYKTDSPGAKVGKHHVSVSTAVDAEGERGDEDYQPGQKESIPVKYGPDGDLHFDVVPGPNTIDIDLTS